MGRVFQVLAKAVVSTTRKVVSGMAATMERVVQVLVKAVVSTTKKVVSGMTALVPAITALFKSAFSMMEEFAEQLGVSGPEVLLLGVLECFFGGAGWIATFAFFVLKIIIMLRPWKKD